MTCYQEYRLRTHSSFLDPFLSESNRLVTNYGFLTQFLVQCWAFVVHLISVENICQILQVFRVCVMLVLAVFEKNSVNGSVAISQVFLPRANII